jgi:hypothetical protein
MTFQEFIATKRHVDDVATAIGQPGMMGDKPQPGLVYDGTFYICDPCEATAGNYWTEIENTQPEGPLHEVERRLYLFAAAESPDWVDHDFVMVYPVRDADEGELLGVIECVIDQGIRPRRVSDSLPYWASDWFLRNYENCPAGVGHRTFAVPFAPYFMV